MISVTHVIWAADTQSMAEVTDNLRMCGAVSVKADWDKKQGVWRIEYEMRRDEKDE